MGLDQITARRHEHLVDRQAEDIEAGLASTKVSHVYRGIHEGLLVWSSKLSVDGFVVWVSNPSAACFIGLGLKTGEWQTDRHVVVSRSLR
jgi:hypothetical protein